MRVLFSHRLIVVSKPRCGSTSLRRLMNQIMEPSAGDIAVDEAGQRPPYHPHHSAPLIHKLLKADGHDIEGMTTIIVIRHPVEMLWSYYKYFKPDINSRYTFVSTYDPSRLMQFEDWILKGRVGIDNDMRALAPEWISSTNLSPLSLEAHSEGKDGVSVVDHVFRIEEPRALMDWLRQRTGRDLELPHVNASADAALPRLGADALNRIREMFPKESQIYNV